jgi:hypothetical protein
MSKRRLFAPAPRLLWAVKLVLALAVLVVSLSPTPSEASLTRCGTEIYYWDSTFSNIVGMHGWLPENCNCMSYSWGVISSYRTFEDSIC